MGSPTPGRKSAGGTDLTIYFQRRQPDKRSTMASEITIYIIDDDEALRRSLERLLRVEGFATVSCDSSLNFIDMVSNPAPGCILLDVGMPGMDGLELLGRLKGIGLRLPVILM